MDDLVSSLAKKKHKKKTTKKKQPKTASEKPAKQNTKAFTFSGGRRSVHRRFQHASEVEEKRLRKPRIFKTPEEPPPIVVVVQGPKSVGKSTLITSLVKQYSKRNISSINGPITMVSSKSRRVTLIECGNSMIDMIDCCKIADIALVMIDGSYGYEMETFEFVNMMQVHGFPRIIGILTHLDAFKDNKNLRRTKKVLKKRFWSEIYDGAKMFYFTGVQYGRYKKSEILNLTRYISSQKPPNISWRLSHPYTVSLRHEVTGTEGDSCNVSFYGYVYGGKINVTNKLHIPGAGDFGIESITNFQDPCQIQMKERTLKDKNRNIYAPYCDVGSLVLDDDAMYIQLFKTKEHFTEMPDEDKENISEAVQMVRTLQKIDQYKPNEVELNIINEPKELKDEYAYSSTDETDLGSNESNNDDATDDESDEEDYENEENEEQENEDNDESEEEDEDVYLADSVNDGDLVFNGHDSSLNDKESRLYQNHKKLDTDESGYSSTDDTSEEDSEDEEEDDEVDGLKNNGLIEVYDEISQRVYFADSASRSTLKDFSRVLEEDLGITWDEQKLRALREAKFLNLADDNEEDPEEEEGFENDPESEKFKSIQEEEQRKLFQETLRLDSIGNVGHFVKICVTGFPSSFLDNLGSRPIILGSIQQSEHGLGFMQVKIKRHRWFPKILKTNDPLLFSVGWRRFQSLPVYCMEDRNQTRNKMLKYTPEHLHCLANIYGPLSPPNFGILAVKNWDRISNYRISASGVTVGTNQNYRIVKKLKLIGEPYKIMKNTCFIKNMFNSELEVIKCIGSKIQTASGIRGQIKKPIDKNGAFRATFEDKILLSDLVVLKSWIGVETKPFYNLLVDSDKFKRVKSIAELKKYDDARPDSKYERKELLRRPVRHFNEIRIPKPIIEKLPFSSKPKVVEHDKDDTSVSFDASEHEKKIARMLHKLHTIRKDRLEKRNEALKEYKSKKARELEKLEQAKSSKLREIKRKRNIKSSKTELNKRAKLLL
ncbi:hypothetical protein MACJ_002468 [Theileria orientalis]|uniref:Bms1-type G domain-containing protein n=1 Tax=Theileria orientalis TaxID=68886 RepID=A0A976M6B1_THEOR|nr:hypothetical protein MACJ_002468 [Theileria orientalis]